MNANLARKAVLSLLAACLLSLMALAQDYKSLVGKWKMTSETDSDPVEWTLLVKDTDGKLTASLASENGETPAQDVAYKDGILKFQAPYQGNYYDVELKEAGGKLDGSWSGQGNSGRTSGVKAAE